MPIIDVDRLKRGGQQFASGFTPGQKVLSVLAMAGLGLGLFAFTQWAATTEYAPLYSGLDQRDAADITSELDSQGVAYKLENGGTSILVPKNDVYQTRLNLSSQGLPSGGDGYALLDKKGNSITASEFSQRIDYQRAVQTELANTIMAIDGVRAATVNLTLPDNDSFVGADEQQAKAAVLLDLGTGNLTSESTQAVVHLVASSVANLSPDAVTVTDTRGQVLAAPGTNDDLATNQNLAKTASYESAMASKLEAMLTRSLGPGKASVVVTAEMNFDEVTETSDEVTPELNDDGTPRSETLVDENETFEGPGNQSSGVLGPDGSPAAATDSNISYEKNKTQSEILADRVLRQTKIAGGAVTGLNVAVMVDEKAVPDGTGELTELLSTAAGIDPARGDTIAVQATTFDEETQKALTEQITGAAGAQSQNQMLGLVRYVVTLLIVGIVLFLAWRSIKKAQAAMGPMRVALDLAELEAAGGLAGLGSGGAALGELGAINDAVAALPDSPRQLEPQRSPVEQEITDLIDRQPDEVAQTLRGWLADRRS